MALDADKGKYVWMDGKFVPWEDATIHIASHVIHYGSGVFEGIRCYKNKRGSACFRLHDHMSRLFDSAKIYRMDIPFACQELVDVAQQLIRRNEQEDCYVRPLVYRGYKELGVNPLDCPVNVAMLTWKWGKYLGPEAANGVDVKFSSWNRLAPNTLPTLAKACANYMNAQLMKMEAKLHGYVEALSVDANGFVCEGSGENIFAIRKGKIYTPPMGASILPGLTRDTVMQFAADLGMDVIETMLNREFLYLADELFFTGTAAEITPIRSVDKIKIGEGKPGPITQKLEAELFGVLQDEKEDRYKWMTYVDMS